MTNMYPYLAQQPHGWAASPSDTTPISDVVQLTQGRAHEFCGAARRMLALWALCGMGAQGAHLWIRPGWDLDRLNPQGLADWLDPGTLILLDTPHEMEALACAEEALRSGAVASIVVELRTPPALTPLRRLHLAAAAGLARRRTHQRNAGLLALVLTPGDGGTPGVESRWQLAPCPPSTVSRGRVLRAGSVCPFWQLRRLRARMAPPATWHVAQSVTGTLQITAVPDARSA